MIPELSPKYNFMDLSGVVEIFFYDKQVTSFASRTLDRRTDLMLSEPVTKFIFVERNRRQTTLELDVLLLRKH